MQTKSALIYGFCAIAVLARCTTAQLQTAQSEISVGINAACADVAAAQKLNPTSPSAPWAAGACGSATAVASLVQNSATLVWLGQIQQQLAAKKP